MKIAAVVVGFAVILLDAFVSISAGPATPSLQAQTSQDPAQAPAKTGQKKDLSPEEIIKEFSAKETEFYDAWMQYTYRQTAVVAIRSVDGYESKERMMLVSEVVFNDDGTREVRELERRGRLQKVRFTKKDEDVITNLQPFALTVKELTLYNLKYVGKEKVDELNCYVFSVKPKSTKGDRFYFDGRIYVDDQDLQIVRTVGKPVPQTRDEQFPEFETLRQVIDSKYWFPVWTHSDSVLNFPDNRVRIEETITYEDYKRFGSKAKIDYGIKK